MTGKNHRLQKLASRDSFSFGAEDDLLSREGASSIGQRVSQTARCDPDPAVYFLEARDVPLVKIGTVRRADTIQARIETLQIGCPYELRLAFMLMGAGQSHESRLHKLFAAQWLRGEWFRKEGPVAAVLATAAQDPDEASGSLWLAIRA